MTQVPHWRVERLDAATDVDAVLRIHEEAVRRPWTRDDVNKELHRPDLAWILVIRAPTDPVVGFCWLWRIFDELHVHDIAIARKWRRRGAARVLLTGALDMARQVGVTRATLEVRRSNAAALALYAELGFVVRGVRRGYYAAPREDALVLWREPPCDA